MSNDNDERRQIWWYETNEKKNEMWGEQKKNFFKTFNCNLIPVDTITFR